MAGHGETSSLVRAVLSTLLPTACFRTFASLSAGCSRILSTLSTALVPPGQVQAAAPTKPKVVAGDT